MDGILANSATSNAHYDYGGGGYMIPPLPVLLGDSPPFGGPAVPCGPLFGDGAEFPAQPAARLVMTTKVAAIHIKRFIRSPR